MMLRDFHYPRTWVGVWLFGWVLCIVLSLSPPISLGAPPDSDKVGHLIAYFVLSVWAVLIFRTHRAHWLAALALVGLGIAMEFAQALLTVDRMGDPRDAVADAMGVLAGVVVGYTPLATFLQRLEKGDVLR